MEQKNIKEAAKLHVICISSNNDRHPVPKIFTPLHYTCQHFISTHLNFTHLHFTTLHYSPNWLNASRIPYRPISYHITTLHLTSLHCTFRRLSSHFYSFRFILLIITFLTLFLKISGLQPTFTDKYLIRKAKIIKPAVSWLTVEPARSQADKGIALDGKSGARTIISPSTVWAIEPQG
jgi:hypothetical protein